MNSKYYVGDIFDDSYQYWIVLDINKGMYIITDFKSFSKLTYPFNYIDCFIKTKLVTSIFRNSF